MHVAYASNPRIEILKGNEFQFKHRLESLPYFNSNGEKISSTVWQLFLPYLIHHFWKLRSCLEKRKKDNKH